MELESLSKPDREALKAIYRLTRDVDEAHTGDLAERLGLSRGTVTATVKRLADRDLVVHRPYRGVVLSTTGRRLAVAAIRRHRIVERFLADMLGYGWQEADRLATTFEHELPREVEQRLFVALEQPDTCPHGFPIPAPETVDLPDMPALDEVEPGSEAVIAVPGSTAPEVVEFLEELGLRPGVLVEVREKHPFDGPLVLRVGERECTLGRAVARQVFVQHLEHTA